MSLVGRDLPDDGVPLDALRRDVAPPLAGISAPLRRIAPRLLAAYASGEPVDDILARHDLRPAALIAVVRAAGVVPRRDRWNETERLRRAWRNGVRR